MSGDFRREILLELRIVGHGLVGACLLAIMLFLQRYGSIPELARFFQHEPQDLAIRQTLSIANQALDRRFLAPRHIRKRLQEHRIIVDLICAPQRNRLRAVYCDCTIASCRNDNGNCISHQLHGLQPDVVIVGAISKNCGSVKGFPREYPRRIKHTACPNSKEGYIRPIAEERAVLYPRCIWQQRSVIAECHQMRVHRRNALGESLIRLQHFGDKRRRIYLVVVNGYNHRLRIFLHRIEILLVRLQIRIRPQDFHSTRNCLL